MFSQSFLLTAFSPCPRFFSLSPGVQPAGEVWSDNCILALGQAVSNRLMRVEIVGKRDDGTVLVNMQDISSDPQADVAELLLTLRYASPLGDDRQPDTDTGHAHSNYTHVL